MECDTATVTASIDDTDAEINFDDISDTEDPSYTPQSDKNIQKNKNIRDYFNIRSKSQPSSSSSLDASDATNSCPSSSGSNVQALTRMNNADTMLKATKLPYLDGKFFKPIIINEQDKKVHGQCQLCLPKDIVIKGFFGVSTNFLKHLRNAHGKAIDEYNTYKQMKKSDLKRVYDTSLEKASNFKTDVPKKQTKITESFSKNTVFLNQGIFDKRIVNFIVSTMSPINIVDNPAFVSLFDGMGLHVMHRTTAVKKIEDFFLDNTARVKSDLEKASYVCTTADIWSAKHRSFLGVTGHWINEDFERCSAALACHRFSGIHSYDRITELLEDIHLQFNLRNDKLVATITDNGSNFVKAFREFGPSCDSVDENDDGQEDEIEFFDLSSNIVLPKHVRCASHTMNLIATVDVKNAIQRNTTLRTRHTNAVAKCTILWKMAGKPKSSEIIKQILGHTLSYPGATRWNSMYDSISQILKCKEHFEELFEKLNIKHQMFKDSEIEYLFEYCTILQPLANAIDILQGDQNTYFGYLLPCLGSLYKKFTRMESSTIMIARPILEACQNGLLKRFSMYFKFSTSEAKDATIASFTLPQFKLRWKNCFLNFIEEDLTESITKFILEKEHDINSEDNFETAQKEYKYLNLHEFFELDTGDSRNDHKNKENNGKQNTKKKVELEILQYLNDPSMEIESLKKYPFIKKLFFKYNTCLPSSAPVERLFSFAEIINSPRRHALSDKHFEELVILKANSKRYNFF